MRRAPWADPLFDVAHLLLVRIGLADVYKQDYSREFGLKLTILLHAVESSRH